jgi:hypothetical protein
MAETLEARAAKMRGEEKASEWPEWHDSQVEGPAKALMAAAKQCRARSAEAKAGYLLLDGSEEGIHFQMNPANHELVTTCQAAGRCKYIEPQRTIVGL